MLYKSIDIVDNTDEFIHVARRMWDVICYNEDPIYDIEGHFQICPSQVSYDIRQEGNDIVTYISRGDLVLFSLDHFWSYLEDFDEYSFDLLDLFYEEDYQT
jgi:hypothetical protein